MLRGSCPVSLTYAASTSHSPCSWFAFADSTKGTPAPDKPPLPLPFRESHECTSSECYLIALDMHFWTSPNRPKIYVNPQVNVGASKLPPVIVVCSNPCHSPCSLRVAELPLPHQTGE